MHPLIYLIAEVALTIFIIGFTSPHSALRPAGLLLITVCVFRCIPSCMPYMTRTPWAALVGGYSVTYLYHYMDLALLSRWSFEHDAPVSGLVRPDRPPCTPRSKSTSPTSLPAWEKLKFGIKLTSTFRFVGTQYEVRNTPKTNPTSSRDFLRRTFLGLCISYCVLDLINAQTDPAIASRFLTPTNIPILARLHELTAEECLIRSVTVIAAGVCLTCVQGGIYHTCALLAVRTGLCSPAEWPPFYGSVRDAYTLRRFWDMFWHQTNTRKFSSMAHYITHVLFGLSRGTTVARYTRILIAFTSSGIMHLVADRAAGVSFHDSGAMRFFTTQALGVMLEDCAVRLYYHAPSSMRLSSRLARLLGFVWVFVFLTWSVPAYLYPMMWRANQGLQDSTIPFSFFGTEAEPVKAIGLLSLAGVIALFR